jgi:hypothetical protein
VPASSQRPRPQHALSRAAVRSVERLASTSSWSRSRTAAGTCRPKSCCAAASPGIAVKEREALYEQITGKIAVEALRPSYLIFNDGFARTPQRASSPSAPLDVTLVGAGDAADVAADARDRDRGALRLAGPGALQRRSASVADGKSFTLYKFRSMRATPRSTGPVWAQKDDPRITRSGRFMRKTRLDELPQLFNVLAGDMSLVGPRPERPVFVEDLARQIPYYHQRHIVKPGLTGWAQINYPYGNTVEDALQKLQYDLFYIKNQSWLFDLSILFQTRSRRSCCARARERSQESGRVPRRARARSTWIASNATSGGRTPAMRAGGAQRARPQRRELRARFVREPAERA